MIPKRIIYCWFGKKELPKSVKFCIDSWKRHCPDYEIVEINESNFDVNSIPYTQQMYKQKKYAFVSDYARLKAVYEHGGIYLDTDVELLRSLDPLLGYRCYFGFEYKTAVNTGHGFGSEKGHPILREMLKVYEDMSPENGKLDPIICTQINTDVLERHGLTRNGKTQFLEDSTIAVFSPDFFNPARDGRQILKNENTFSVHWYDASWITPWMRLRTKLSLLFQRLFGEPISVWLKKRVPFLKK